jgi:hypothetical protein
MSESPTACRWEVFSNAEQGKRAQTPPPCPAPHPRLNRLNERRTYSAETITLPVRFQAHPALESKPVFRLTPRWNQISISGSFLDWKMLIARLVKKLDLHEFNDLAG